MSLFTPAMSGTITLLPKKSKILVSLKVIRNKDIAPITEEDRIFNDQQKEEFLEYVVVFHPHLPTQINPRMDR